MRLVRVVVEGVDQGALERRRPLLRLRFLRLCRQQAAGSRQLREIQTACIASPARASCMGRGQSRRVCAATIAHGMITPHGLRSYVWEEAATGGPTWDTRTVTTRQSGDAITGDGRQPAVVFGALLQQELRGHLIPAALQPCCLQTQTARQQPVVPWLWSMCHGATQRVASVVIYLWR